jgi:hypothetical protein
MVNKRRMKMEISNLNRKIEEICNNINFNSTYPKMINPIKKLITMIL